MKFSDGLSFDTGREYRLTHRFDGWYVVGRGILAPVKSPEEGNAFIAEMKDMEKLHRRKDEIVQDTKK